MAAIVESLEPRLQLSGQGGEIVGPTTSLGFGQLAVGDSSNNEQTVTIKNTGSQSVQLDTPFSHDTNQVAVDSSGFPSGGFLDPGSTATFNVIANTSANLTINTTVTVEYNDGNNEFFDIPTTGTIGAGSNPDTTPPTAKITYAKALRVNAKYYYFAVTYTDDTTVDPTTLDDSDILVSRKHYPTLHGLLISKSTSRDVASLTAVYAVRYGRHGLWTSAYDGTWIISLAQDQVADTSGNTAAAKTLGQVAFLIPTVAAKAVAAPAVMNQSPSIFSTDAISRDAIWNAE